MNTNDTLTGGRTMTATFFEGPTKEIIVKQIRVGDYQKCFPMVDEEIALTAFVCGLTPAEMALLDPTSYEELYTAVREVNEKGFFTFATRHLARAEKQMAAMPPEMLKLVLARAASPSPSPSPVLRQPRV